MISLEQVKLLETKVAKAIEYVERVTAENETLLLKEAELQGKLESYQKRIDELEVLVIRFKEDQSRIEDGILSALDRLNQFEDAIEKSLVEKQQDARPEIVKPVSGLVQTAAVRAEHKAARPAAPAAEAGASSGAGEIFFEIPETDAAEDDAEDPLAEFPSLEESDKPPADGELDIF
jgi:FtsZ-binding cell division protein ZapB